jgi:uncharacterized protein YbjT (DUF2867 family)
MSNDRVILVTAATGNVGRQVVSQLLTSGARVRALTRNPKSAGLPREVDVVRADLAGPETVDAAVKGAGAVFLLWRLPTTDTAPAVVERLAKHTRRIVFLSSSAIRDDIEEQTNVVAKVHADIEHSIERSAREWTFLRPDGFATNALWWWGKQIRRGDVVRWPYGAAAMAPIHERDIAAVAVRALQEEGHDGKKYVLSGPESLTLVEQVQIIAEAIGRPLRFEEIAPDAARQQLLAVMPQEIVDVLLDVLAGLTAGPAPITTVVREITGSPARAFREWASDHAADFR